MGRVEVPVELLGPGSPPETLAFVGELNPAKVVEIAGLGVKDFTEDAAADEVKGHELDPVVAAVLHHLAVLARFLGRLDQGPAIVQGHGRRDLGRGVLAVLHGREADRDVPFPRRGGEDQVEVFGFAHPLEVPLPFRVGRGKGLARGDDPLLGPFDLGRDDVAEGFDLDAVDVEEVLDMGRAHAPDSNEADPDDRDRGGLEGRAAFAGNLRQRRAEQRLEAGQGGADAGHSGGGGFKKITAFVGGGIVFHRFLLGGLGSPAIIKDWGQVTQPPNSNSGVE